jgi:diguanylate cyclase (GGDEF)-like protein
MKFLLVEDDRALADAIRQLLLAHHYVMDLAADGIEGRDMAGVFSYDLILMDWMLPKLDGMHLCQQLREEGNNTPIILLTARDASTDRVAGLDAGADDYLVKPFEFEELLARIRALLRRAEGIVSPILRWGDLQLDPRSSKVSHRGTPIALTPKEYALLELFLRNPSRIFSLDSLLDKVWPFEDAPTVASVRTHIKGLRQKLRRASVPNIVSTVYGLGYRLKATQPSDLALEQPSDIKNYAEQNDELDLTSLWQSVQASYSQRTANVACLLHELRPGTVDSNVRQQILSETHALAGSLGSFGFQDVSTKCREIEKILCAHDSLNADLISRLDWLGVSISQSLTSAPTADCQTSSIDQTTDQTTSSQILFPIPSATVSAELPPEQLFQLLIVDVSSDSIANQNHTIADLQIQSSRAVWLTTCAEMASRYHMQVVVTTSITEARELLFSKAATTLPPSQSKPHVVLFNFGDSAELPANSSAEFELLAELQAMRSPIPTVVLSAAASFENRVRIARLGVDRLLQIPAMPAEVLETAIQVLQKGTPPAAKLVVVDDDPAILSLAQRLLQPWGFRLQLLDDPQRFWQTLETIEPDLVLLDIDISSLSGFDLCRVMRNATRWHELPVLFMSAHTDAQTIQKVFAVGADDYIRKPIVAPELVARVLGWLERSRAQKLRSEVDSLTGVDNRQKSTQLLNQLLSLAQRQQQPLCFAIIDLDHFKAINDCYGHPVGDRVLRRFGTCLRRAFRSEDVVGRWGGEEFVVGLYGVNGLEGVQRLRQLLQTWQAELLEICADLPPGSRQKSEANSCFEGTFSAGIAAYPNNADSIQSLYTVADKALYEAKKAGRNQVILALQTKSI